MIPLSTDVDNLETLNVLQKFKLFSLEKYS